MKTNKQSFQNLNLNEHEDVLKLDLNIESAELKIDSLPYSYLSDCNCSITNLELKYYSSDLIPPSLEFSLSLLKSLKSLSLKIYDTPSGTIHPKLNLLLKSLEPTGLLNKIEFNDYCPNDAFLIHYFSHFPEVNFSVKGRDFTKIEIENAVFYYKYKDEIYQLKCGVLGIGSKSLRKIIKKTKISINYIYLGEGEENLRISKLKNCKRTKINPEDMSFSFRKKMNK
mmetsp:Transcript_17543/g.15461  ORF Transcript_17543/g.15461 Transcript_17543/m.15461 type:complete len:226 (-) Transcript_17543:1065-1742(-)